MVPRVKNTSPNGTHFSIIWMKYIPDSVKDTINQSYWIQFDSIFSFKCVLIFLPKIENQETAMYCYVLYAILFIFPG